MMKNKKGITLIALIITIIVLLILAGISISLVIGDNGVLTRAQSSKDKTDLAQIQEEIQLAWSSVEADGIPNKWSNEQKRAALQEELRKQDSSATATLEEDVITVNYKGQTTTISLTSGTVANIVSEDTSGEIDWDTIKGNAQKHPDQTSTNDIGIDANGNVCNLDLWDYEFNESAGDFSLGAYGTGSGYNTTPCYLPFQYGYDGDTGVEMENIVCPQYIKPEGANQFYPITLVAGGAFYHCTNLKTIVLPDTVYDIENNAFNGCSSLISVRMPETVNFGTNGGSGSYVFCDCTSLASLKIPKPTSGGYSTYGGLIEGCTSLEKVYIDSQELLDALEGYWGEESLINFGINTPNYSWGASNRSKPKVGILSSLCNESMKHLLFKDYSGSYDTTVYAYDSTSEGYTWFSIHDEHTWTNGICTGCGQICEHSSFNDYSGNYIDAYWNDGVCTNCGKTCEHDWDSYNSWCNICSKYCDHPTWTDGECDTCGHQCEHNENSWYWNDGVCTYCGTRCTHDWHSNDEYGWCDICQMSCDHSTWTAGECDTCGYECNHNWNDGVCTNCGLRCTHNWSFDGCFTSCTICGKYHE